MIVSTTALSLRKLVPTLLQWVTTTSLTLVATITNSILTMTMIFLIKIKFKNSTQIKNSNVATAVKKVKLDTLKTTKSWWMMKDTWALVVITKMTWVTTQLSRTNKQRGVAWNNILNKAILIIICRTTLKTVIQKCKIMPGCNNMEEWVLILKSWVL